MVHHTFLSKHDPVIALGGFARNEAVGDVERDLLRIAVGGSAKAAATRQFEPDEIPARHALPALGADRSSRDQGDPPGRAGPAAVAAARRIADALEIAQHRDRRAVGAAQFDDLAEAAAEFPGAARALAELAPAKQHRSHGFGRLDRDRPHTAWEGGDVEPILARTRASAAAMEDRRAERLEIRWRPPLLRPELVEHLGAAVDLRDPQRGRALGGNTAFHHLVQTAEDDIGQHVADRVPGGDRARPLCVEQTALGRADRDRGERAGIVRHLGCDQAFHPEGGVSGRVVEHDIDAEGARRRRAGIIDMDAILADRHLGGEGQRPVVTVHRQAVAVGALLQFADRLDRRKARGLDDVLAQPVEIGDAELLHHLHEPAAAFVVARGERIDVALDLQRLAHIGPDDAQQVLVHTPLARQRHQRDRQPLLVHLAAVWSHTEPADIDDMDRAGEEPHRLGAQKGRADHGQIVQVAASQPRIIRDVMVAGPHGLQREGVEEMLDRRRHRIDVAGGAGDRLRQHVAVAVEHTGREVARLAHRRRERGAHQGLRLFLDHGDQPRPHDLHVDLR